MRALSALQAPAALPALRPLHIAVANRDNALAKIVVIGDSVSEGTAITGDYRGRYMNRLQELLRGAYPTSGVRGGPGYFPAWYGAAQPTAMATLDLTANLGGTSTAPQVTDSGLGARGVTLKNGAAISWTAEGTSVGVHYSKDQFSVPFNVFIDGVQVATNVPTSNPGGLVGGFIWQSGQLSPGLHTVRVATTDNSGFWSKINGCEFFYGDEAKGIRIYDGAKNGASATFNTETAEVLQSLTTLQPDCVIVQLLTNDAVFGTAAGPYQTALAATLSRIHTAMGSKAYTLVLLSVPQTSNTILDDWANYIQAMWGAARTSPNAANTVVLDMAEWMGPSVAADVYNLWADPAHPNIKGHAVIADRLMHALNMNGAGKNNIDLPVIQIPAGQTDTGAPPLGSLYLYAQNTAGRPMPRITDDSGYDWMIQPHFGLNGVRMISPGNGAAPSLLGMTQTTLGTMSNPTPTTTSFKTSNRRVTLTSAATGGSLTGVRSNMVECWRGNSANRGGFHFMQRISLTTMQSGQRGFFGLHSSTAAPTNIDPLATLGSAADRVGLAFNANTGNWRLIHGTGTPAATAIDLGASFPINNTAVVELILWAPPNASTIQWRVKNLENDAVATGTISTNLPSATAFMGYQAWMTNNATAAAVAFDLYKMYIETDN